MQGIRLPYRLMVLLVCALLASVPSAQVQPARDASGMVPLETSQQISVDRAVAFPVDI